MRRIPTVLFILIALLVFVACSDAPEQPITDGNANQIASIEPTLALPTITPTPPLPLSYPTAVDRTVDRYVVRSGDTLTSIATRFNLGVQELMRYNGLSNPNAIYVGQTLRFPTEIARQAPAVVLLPDSEVVYSPAYVDFDVNAFVSQKGGYLASYREKVEGEMMSGPQIIQMIAERYSVGPRVLLALLEFQGGWVTNKTPAQNQVSYSMGLIDPAKATLFFQASWAANHLNEGYYGKTTGRLLAFQFRDRTRASIPLNTNPGSVAVENVLALNSTWDNWITQIGPSGFMSTYLRLFGDPVPIEPLVPPGLRQPVLRLPWKSGAKWYFTGGPHSPWGDFAAWGAIDLTPSEAGGGGCAVAADWAVAAAPGKVVRAEHGRVILSLENASFQGSGWNLMYMHMAAAGRVAEGAQVKRGDPIGRPSCEGGYGNASHLHFARLYNGEWIDPIRVPLILSGWQVIPSAKDYDGKMVRGSESHEALDTKNDYRNAMVADEVQ